MEKLWESPKMLLFGKPYGGSGLKFIAVNLHCNAIFLHKHCEVNFNNVFLWTYNVVVDFYYQYFVN